MGFYYYMLTAKTRRMKTQDGESVSVNLYKFSDKASSYAPERYLKAKIARAETHWKFRDWPRYVVSEWVGSDPYNEKEGFPIYEECESAHFGENYLEAYGLLAGYAYPKGARIIFERWERYIIELTVGVREADFIKAEAIRRLRESGFVDMKNIRIDLRTKNRAELVITGKSATDLVKAKMVIAGIQDFKKAA